MNKIQSFSRAHLLHLEKKPYFIKDPIYGSINFSKDQIWLYELVNTFEFQRLQKLRQLSLSYMNFPGAIHTRYTHSLGVYELCNKFIQGFLGRGYLDLEEDKIAINIAFASALLHDIGHGPLSHAFEYAYPGFSHEIMGIQIIKNSDSKINQILREKAISDGLTEDFYVDEVCKVLSKESTYLWVVSLISSDLDVDRLDYLVRDSFYSGINYGRNIDIDLFIKWAAIKDGKLVFLDKIKNGLELFFISRKHMYEDLYENYVGNMCEHLFFKSCKFIRENIDSFSQVPDFDKYEFLFRDPVGEWEISRFLELNDDELMSFVRSLLVISYKNLEVRKWLGYLFGIWMNEKGEFCTLKDFGEFKLDFDVNLLQKQAYKKDKRDTRVKIWNPKTGEIKDFVKVN